MSNPDPSDIPVVVLCGGQGTRIREASEHLPKPLIDIGGKPILWHIMKVYGAHGFRRFILCLGYKSWEIKRYFLEYTTMMSDLRIDTRSLAVEPMSIATLDDWEVTLTDTGLETGTGGRLARIKHLVDTPYFMVSYGDGIGDVDLGLELQTLALSSHTGLVTGVNPTSRYGELTVSDDSVTGFAEKPTSDGWVSGGFFAFRQEFLDYIPDDDDGHLLERAPLQNLAADKGLGVYPHHGFWMGMDTYREYMALNEIWATGSAPWKIW